MNWNQSKRRSLLINLKTCECKAAAVVNVLQQQTAAHSVHIRRDPRGVINQID